MSGSTVDNSIRLPTVINLPNLLTFSRLILAVVFFVFLAVGWFKTSLVLFIIAASTDWLDGYLARKLGETTTLGRILDPFVDKVIVLGAFIFLLPVTGSGLSAWMVTLVVARELLVTGLRSFLEGESIAFGADWAGKSKMILQCIAIGWIIFYLEILKNPGILPFAELAGKWLGTLRTLLVWIAVLVTAFSGISYCWRAARLFTNRP